MPFITSLGSAALFGFGFSNQVTAGGDGGGPYMGSLYYYEAANESDTTSTWATLEKWYKNSNHTTSATALPSDNNDTVLLNNTSANIETWSAPKSIDLTTKTLTLNAHTYVESPACAAAIQFDTQVTGSAGSSLVLNGHIEIVGVDHSMYYMDYPMGGSPTNYYFEPNISVTDGLEGYIYQGQYNNNVAAKALDFTTQKPNGNYYNVTTNSAGKVTAVTPIPDVPPTDIEELRSLFGRLSFNPMFIGYTYLETTNDCNQAPDNLILMLPGDRNTKPVYVLSFIDGETGDWTPYAPGVYSGSYVEHITVSGGTEDRKYTTDAEGFIGVGYQVCTAP